MGRGPLIQVEGARELRRALKEAGDDASDLKDAHREIGEIVAGEARSIAPRRSGTLAGTPRAARQKGGVVVRAGGGAASEYAGVIHFGWPAHNIEPQPFLYDALDTRRGEVIEAYETAMAKIIDRI